MHLERDGDGHRIRYAIADVPDVRAARRRARPGHPRARPDRLLPGRAGAAAPRGAVRGRREPAAGCRAPRLRLGPAPRRRGAADVGARCTARWCAASSGSTTRTVQAAIDAGTDDERFLLLQGGRRAPHRAGAGARGREPADARAAGDGTRRRRLHPRVPAARRGRGVERAGLAAHRHGRRHDDAGCRRGRAAHHAGPDARGGGVVPAGGPRRWAPSGREDLPYGEFVRGLDRTNPRHLALIHEATALFRGAGYTAFDGEPPDAARARGGRRPLRPRHRAAAPARRPLRPGRLRGRVPRRRGAGCRARGAARSSPS